MQLLKRKVWDGTATLIGAIMGAGILAIPAVFAKAGFLTGLVILLVLGAAMVLINCMIGEVVLRTKGHHQLTGYAKKYLGIWGGRWMSFSLLVGIYGALIAYAIGMGEIIDSVYPLSQSMWTWIVLVVLGTLLFHGSDWIEDTERWLSPLKVVILAGIVLFLFFSESFNTNNLTVFSSNHLLVPYGVVLFALLGTAVIPEVKEEMQGKWKSFRVVLLIGSIIPLIAYGLFAAAVVGVSGVGTTEVATSGIGIQFGSWAVFAMNVFALLAMATAFLALGLALRDMFVFDWNFKPLRAACAVLLVPAFFLTFGTSSFLGSIEIAGAVAGGVDGILIVFMHYTAKKLGKRKPEFSVRVPMWVRIVLCGMFILGIIYGIGMI